MSRPANGSMEVEVETSRLSLNQLIEPSLRCFALVLVLLISTGPLIRQLFTVAILDSAALVVGTLWFLGDLIPSVCLVVLLHDAILTRRRDKSLDAISTIFLALYLLDLIIYLLCTDPKRVHHYRLIFFHLQIWLAMAYVFAKVARYDLRLIKLRLEPLLKLSRQLIGRLEYKARSEMQLPETQPPLPSQPPVEQSRVDSEIVAPVVHQDQRELVKTTRKRKATTTSARRRRTTTKQTRASKRRRIYKQLPVVNILVSSESRNNITGRSGRRGSREER